MGLRQGLGTVLCLGVVLQTPLAGARTRAAVSTADPVIIEGHVKDEAGQPLPACGSWCFRNRAAWRHVRRPIRKGCTTWADCQRRRIALTSR